MIPIHYNVFVSLAGNRWKELGLGIVLDLIWIKYTNFIHSEALGPGRFFVLKLLADFKLNPELCRVSRIEPVKDTVK